MSDPVPNGIVPIIGRNSDFNEYFSNLNSFPFSCNYLGYNILLTNGSNIGFKIILVCLTHILPFVQVTCTMFLILIFFSSIRKHLSWGNGRKWILQFFGILKTDSFVLKHFTHKNLVIVCIYTPKIKCYYSRKKYLTFKVDYLW